MKKLTIKELENVKNWLDSNKLSLMMRKMMNCFCGVWLTDERRLALFPAGTIVNHPLSEILTISNLRHAASRIWTCAEPEFRLCWKWDIAAVQPQWYNHYTTVPIYKLTLSLSVDKSNLALFRKNERKVTIKLNIKMMREQLAKRKRIY